jgi:aryl-alcohol dehydrogenase-like predicted oxidoreductase
MRYRRLGKAGVKVSEFCLGCLTFGEQADEAEATRIVHLALDAGVNFFDTSNSYAGGKSEEILGRILKGKRDSLVIATKVCSRVGNGPNDAGLSRKHIMNSVEQSLRRLQTDYIDLYQAHNFDPETSQEETLIAFDDLVRQGKVRYIGCSNFAAWQLCRALWVSDRHNVTSYISVQPRYSLISREIETELLPLCQAESVGVMVYNPLAGGFLTGKYRKDAPIPPGTRLAIRDFYRARYWSNRNFAALERLQALSDSSGKSLVQLSLAWVLGNPTITCIIVGASSVGQLRESLTAVDTGLTDGERETCDSLLEDLR